MEPNSIIPKTDDRLLSYFIKELLSLFKGGNSSSDDKFIFALLGLITIVATEPFKVLLRRNIGKLSLSITRLVIAAVLYTLWGILLIGLGSEASQFEEISNALIAGGIFYIFFSSATLILGFSEYSKAKQRYEANRADIMVHLYRGDSIYFTDENQQKVWLNKEPVYCFVASILITMFPVFIDPFLFFVGAPLFVTSISFWFNEYFQIKNVWNVQTRKIQKEQLSQTQRPAGDSKVYNPVITD